MKTIFTASLVLSLSASVALATPMLTIDPLSGSVAGQPGQIVGWGFTLTSDPSFWIGVTSSFLLTETNPAVGFYTDFIGSEGGPSNGVLAPGSPDWTQTFDDGLLTGLGSYAIDPGASPGDNDSGTLRVLYGVFTDDPNTCGECFNFAGSLDASFSVNVVDPVAPEPGTFALLLGAIALLTAREYGGL
jgi:hypothetical protein